MRSFERVIVSCFTAAVLLCSTTAASVTTHVRVTTIKHTTKAVHMTPAHKATTKASTPATIAVPLNSTVTPIPDDCKDTIDNCRYYGRAPCTERVYEAWAKAHCSQYCGFCVPGTSNPTDCHDKLLNCHEFDDGTLCTADSYYAWAYEYCKGYCKFDQCTDVCRDQVNFDCQSVDQALNLCADKQKAKRVCQKYCNLCDLVDGQWAQWSAWGACSVSCGNGTERRQRTCTKPAPAHGGLNCVGSASQLEPCTLSPCPVHGGWGSWGNWSSCSVSCGTGLQNRHRMCDSPRPARQGDHCFGSESDFQICTANLCAARVSAFTVKTPHDVTNSSALTFTTVVLNEGADYNTTTGHFTCSIPGLYFFTLSLTKVRSSTDSINDLVYCYIRKNGTNEVRAYINPNDSYADVGSYGTTASVTLELAQHDVVSVGGCTKASHMETWSLFSGFLISPK